MSEYAVERALEAGAADAHTRQQTTKLRPAIDDPEMEYCNATIFDSAIVYRCTSADVRRSTDLRRDLDP
ncbi:MAG TPA: hypothetical protein VN924_30200 [Bryobacteraceae bacterium]|jgi:hypothetical protein|nr:hypothetical protein [Bryobacteraceae bacterium]